MLEVFVFLIACGLLFQWLIKKSYKVHKKGIVLITGAGTGIGRHAAESLARNGYTVLAGIRFSSEEDEIKLVRLNTLIPFYLDVCKHDACVEAVKRIGILTKSFDLPFVALINNAGFLKSIPIEHHNLQEARLMFETNFFAAMNLIQLLLPLLRESQGRIINLSSFTAMAGHNFIISPLSLCRLITLIWLSLCRSPSWWSVCCHKRGD
jgi:NAD(P)-dependent dehydrogenase (short-subunit alcohol dehydrogenase family)